ncbi:MAG: FGGY family carbohydrate kinase [Clostridiaceae bacterium]|nr:FGGY family carbohydrate kinase [Clostridiaceae bacterium]
MDGLLLGLDIGTTGTKCLAVDADGTIIRQAYQSYPTSTPQPGFAEQNAEDWWQAVLTTVRTCLPEEELRHAVTAIGLSSQGGSLVPIDVNGSPLRPAIVWLDQRGVQESAYFRENLPEDYFYLATGWNLSAGLNAVEILWLKEHEPQIFAGTDKFLSTLDFITGRLTGQYVIDPSNAGISQLYNINERDWDRRILDLIGITPDRLAKVMDSGAPIGTLCSRAADELGLPRQTVVVNGGHDQYCVALGAGAIHDGDIMLATGTSWVALAVSDQPQFNSRTHAAQSIHTVKGKWGSIQSLSNGGICLEWFRSKMERKLPDQAVPALCGSLESYQALDHFIDGRGPALQGPLFFPYFNGSPEPNHATQNRGTFLGLDLSHDRYDLIRAIMEGVVYQTVWMMDTLRPAGQQEPLLLKMLGGAGNSTVWTQMVADILGNPVQKPGMTQAACAGAAILAGLATRQFRTPAEGYKKLAGEDQIIYPDPIRSERYQLLFARYKRLALTLADCYDVWQP